jgi:hypothetical protein
MRRIYESAVGGSPVWQLACALMTVFALHAITHSTSWFVWPWVPAVVFLGPALAYARARPGEGNSETISPSQTVRRLRPPLRTGSPARCLSGVSTIEHPVLAELQRSKMNRVKFASGQLKRRSARRSGLPFKRFLKNPREV